MRNRRQVWWSMKVKIAGVPAIFGVILVVFEGVVLGLNELACGERH